MTERTHHNASPSALKRISLCPGSLALGKQAPRMPDNAAAIEGRMLHEYVHPEKDATVLTEEQQGLIGRCRKCLKTYIGDLAADKEELLFEQKLQLPGMTDEEDFFGEPTRSKKVISYGYGDVIVVRPKLVSVLDWKFGRMPVDPPGQNLQMLAYGVMAALRWNKNHAQIVIYQPRVSQTANYFDLKGDDLTAAWKEIARITEAANEPDAPLHASEAACKYCPALTICPEVEKTSSLVREAQNVREISDPSKVALLLGAARILSKRCDDIEAHARALAEKNGGILTDAQGEVVYRMAKYAAGNISIKDVNEAFDRLSPYMEIDYFLKNFVQVKGPAMLRDDFARRHKERTGETREEGRKMFLDLMNGTADPDNLKNLITQAPDKMRLEPEKKEKE